jgi:hypothetical protein
LWRWPRCSFPCSPKFSPAWSSSARRAFTAAELAAIALALDTSIPALFFADSGQIELPGQAVSAEDYRAILLYAGDDTPLDGVED